MFDLAIISRALDGPGQDVADVAVDEIVQLANRGDIHAAAAQAARAVGVGGTDVRAIVAVLLGVFDERGPAALPAMLDLLTTAIRQRWGALRPSARRDRAVDSALCLMFRSVRASMDFHESARDATWRAWSGPVDHDLAKAWGESARALQAALAEQIPGSRGGVELGGLRARADLYLQRLPPPAAPSEPTAADAPVVRQEVETPPSTPDAIEAPAAVEAAPPGVRMMEVSPALERFVRKLEAFTELVERGDMSKAAIVARDITSEVDSFDPRVYLPRLLTPYFRTLSAHVNAIAPHWETTGSPAWQALEQLYRVDLDAFLEP